MFLLMPTAISCVPHGHVVCRAENCGNIIGEMDREMSAADKSKADDTTVEADILQQVRVDPPPAVWSQSQLIVRD